MGLPVQLLSHPGVARLVSAFRYNRAAYLVLEYCGRGDLHTLVVRGGGGRR
jgi:serine/threonine protein kinase